MLNWYNDTIVAMDERYREWMRKVPALHFPSHWAIKIIPPFGGAMVRFLVEYNNRSVSVYLDCYEELGFFGGEPYWEIYLYQDDVFRCGINDTGTLMAKITEILEG